MKNKLIILTGFGPFNNNIQNLSGQIVKNFPSKIQEHKIIKNILPVSWKRGYEAYKSLLISLDATPKLVILLGIHSKDVFHIENFSWNFKFGQDIDNIFKLGIIKHFSAIRKKTGFNLKRILSVLSDRNGILISRFPGFYLCNYLYYWALTLSNHEYPVLFIHVPKKGKLYECIKKIEMIIISINKSIS